MTQDRAVRGRTGKKGGWGEGTHSASPRRHSKKPSRSFLSSWRGVISFSHLGRLGTISRLLSVSCWARSSRSSRADKRCGLVSCVDGWAAVSTEDVGAVMILTFCRSVEGPEQASQQLPNQWSKRGRLRTSSEVGSCKLGRVQELVQVALLRHRSQSSFIFFEVLCQAEDSQRGEGRQQRQRERE